LSPPFLVSPFHGYTSINSYLDHDLPDYAIDGKIILANGITVTGQPSSYAWPAYYSPVLRQYINYDGHNGYDFGISYQPVYAAAAGKVQYAAWESSDPYVGYGQMILIAHKDGYETLYGHLSKLLVHPGQTVRSGQQIGISGTTGHSTGPHLHFSVYHDCHIVDPYGWSGPGKDPLLSFNGEQSTYLWRLGGAPEILNPLPNWPTYASMIARDSDLLALASPSIPLTHLLLLRLPVLTNAEASSVTAMFQIQLQQEEQQLIPVLQALERHHLVSSFTVLPNLGAVRVEGTAPAAELLGLPGVAAIMGARSVDFAKATQGYHAALTAAVPAVVTPQLFPSTYLDAAETVHISVTAQENGSYVFGFAPPDSTVTISVMRDGKTVGGAVATADPHRGAFVAIVTDGNGQNLRMRVGDVVAARDDGGRTSLLMVPLTVSANPATGVISGISPSGARISLAFNELQSGLNFNYDIDQPSVRGRLAPFLLHSGGDLAPGDPLNVSLVEASGNSEFRWANVPGFRVQEGSSVVRGWEPSGTTWKVSVFGKHRELGSASASVAANGSLQAAVQGRDGLPLPLVSGSHIRVVSGHTVHWIQMPKISVGVSPDGKSLQGNGPAGGLLLGQILDDQGSLTRTPAIRVGTDGYYSTLLPVRSSPGLSLRVAYLTSSGFIISSASAARGLTDHQQSGLIAGTAGPDQVLVLTAMNAKHHAIGGAIVGTSATGSYATNLYNGAAAVHLRSGDSLTVFDGRTATSYPVGRLHAWVGPGMVLHGIADGGKPEVHIWSGLTSVSDQTFRSGHFNMSLAGMTLGSRAWAQVTLGSPGGGQIDVDVRVPSPASMGSAIGELAFRLATTIRNLPPSAADSTPAGTVETTPTS
jgi:hypothetical protein